MVYNKKDTNDVSDVLKKIEIQIRAKTLFIKLIWYLTLLTEQNDSICLSDQVDESTRVMIQHINWYLLWIKSR